MRDRREGPQREAGEEVSGAWVLDREQCDRGGVFLAVLRDGESELARHSFTAEEHGGDPTAARAAAEVFILERSKAQLARVEMPPPLKERASRQLEP